MNLPLFTIRSFGKKYPCCDVDDLRDNLFRYFDGMSITIEYYRPSGIKNSVFADVEGGYVFESYGDNNPINLEELSILASPST